MKIYRIQKVCKFEAAHQLKDLPPDHQCAALHGHSYVVTITLVGTTLDDTGFVVDFGAFGALIRNRYDHKCLNDVMEKNPTAEHLADEIYEAISKAIFELEAVDQIAIERVRVEETSTAWAEVFDHEAVGKVFPG